MTLLLEYKPLMQKCSECGKEIPDEEWVVNWTSCNECFDRHYEEYMREQDTRRAMEGPLCSDLEDTGFPEEG